MKNELTFLPNEELEIFEDDNDTYEEIISEGYFN